MFIKSELFRTRATPIEESEYKTTKMMITINKVMKFQVFVLHCSLDNRKNSELNKQDISNES